jgi:hypothetical protein
MTFKLLLRVFKYKMSSKLGVEILPGAILRELSIRAVAW